MPLGNDEAYREAERKIEAALRLVPDVFSLGGMGLTELPESLCELTQLEVLHVSHNRLTALPETLGKLTHLQVLHLSDNQLTSLPESLRKLTRLQELYLDGNPALGLPEEVLDPAWLDSTRANPPAKPLAILDYYFRMRGQLTELLAQLRAAEAQARLLRTQIKSLKRL